MGPNHCVLVLKNRGKAIPYGDGQRAFVPLKERPDAEARAVPEARDFEPFQTALVRLNDAATSFFTVGCEKAFNVDDSAHWAKGYVEFSINDAVLVGDAQHYFKLFFDFNQHLWARKFSDSVLYTWELEGADFWQAGTSGWTATVWIQTGDVQTADRARVLFTAALAELVTFLVDYPMPIEQRIYPLPGAES